MTYTHSLGSRARKPNTMQARNEAQLISECPFAYTLQLLGMRWRPAILWKVAAGAHGYGVLKRSLPGVSDRMLAQDLAHLVAAGLLARFEEPRGRAITVRYDLTAVGSSLLPSLHELQRWGTQALSAGGHRRQLFNVA